jgi:hypothetical protein
MTGIRIPGLIIWPARMSGTATTQIDDHDVEGVSLTVHAPHPLKGVIQILGRNHYAAERRLF